MNTGENWLGKARLQPATAAGGLLSLFAVVAGLAMVLLGSFEGISLVVVGVLWASWIDYHKRPADKQIEDLTQRIDAVQSKINSLQVRIGMGGN
jgi:hypothetical protein